ncbi:MAG TPA: FHA domain-containing protein [Rudaea sp.]|nr:FHA domain-containing protein [Rudaea sp.]
MADQPNEWQQALAAIDLSAIESLKKLKAEQDQLDERLQSMDELKSNFAPPVFERVRSDYQKRLQALDEQASPLKQAAREQYSSLRELIERFEAGHEAVKLDQQELELRHKLGEFDDKEFQKRIKAIEASVKDKAEARARGLEMKARFLEAFHAESDLDAGPSSPAPTPAPAPAPTAVTGRFNVPADDDIAEARTTDMPGVRPDLTPNKTQIMSAVHVSAVRPAVPLASPPSQAPAAVSAGGATQIFRAARLVPQNPEAGKQSFTLSLKPMSIGADTANDIRIAGPGVEPKHAQINVSMAGFTVIDLGTKHGTRVNAEKIKERQLANEDVIQIGAARFIFREG